MFVRCNLETLSCRSFNSLNTSSYEAFVLGRRFSCAFEAFFFLLVLYIFDLVLYARLSRSIYLAHVGHEAVVKSCHATLSSRPSRPFTSSHMAV